MEPIIDAVVVGAGPAGLSAALFLGRAGRSTVVFDGGKSRIHAVEEIREHLGFDGRSTDEYLKRARDEVLQYGVEIRQASVCSVVPRSDGVFDIEYGDGAITARTVVLATGLKDVLPPLSGLPEAWGRDVRVCPCFDGHEVRGKRFVVFGLPERLAQMASWVWMWSQDVTVVTDHVFNETDSERLRLLDIKVVPGTVTGLLHRAVRLVAIETASGAEVECDAAWIAAPMTAASDLAASLCEVDEIGLAKADKHGRTSRPGVFAIGNASDPLAHLAHASAAGTNVGPVVTLYLLEQHIAARRAA
ncbi:FAD-dependent pyridine nucleotide-disulfide oxidoreductase [Mesorhizobium sp. LSHC420B00]|uniref:NAD(P)/FAD-dependent oxidoreductase n=1 Tax=unclassified Mesorhizobium TaxID=325217 RepID=UPI0003CE0DB6|nr:NAD(P)/FAD-dependent oxidoreductase [Mesorhizobium sp. LSHC420B00]ESX62783.1 FAD-dependent pyridine nucleotide-disulfide oxidoreductase [Mesorhizobium sp. LSHC420B00]